MRKTRIIPAIFMTAALAVPTVAQASVNVNDAGSGFVGKGDVQTAFGLNNNKMQDILVKDRNAYSFSGSQAATQSLSQDLTQSGKQAGTQSAQQDGTMAVTQSATQTAHWVLSCTVTKDGKKGVVVAHNDGTRDGMREGERFGSRTGSRTGVRTGERDGLRTGSRAGTLSGSLNAALNGDPRPGPNQYTGFNMSGWTNARAFSAAASGTPQWGAESFDAWKPSDFGSYTFAAWTSDNFGAYGFGDAVFNSDYTYGDVEWTGWVADQGEHPGDCLRNNDDPGQPVVSDLVNEVTYGTPDEAPVADGAVTDGVIHEGAITDGAITDGAVSYSAPVVPGAVSPVAGAAVKVSATGPDSKGVISTKALN